jgi:hypothetical protein
MFGVAEIFGINVVIGDDAGVSADNNTGDNSVGVSVSVGVVGVGAGGGVDVGVVGFGGVGIGAGVVACGGVGLWWYFTYGPGALLAGAAKGGDDKERKPEKENKN